MVQWQQLWKITLWRESGLSLEIDFKISDYTMQGEPSISFAAKQVVFLNEPHFKTTEKSIHKESFGSMWMPLPSLNTAKGTVAWPCGFHAWHAVSIIILLLLFNLIYYF